MSTNLTITSAVWQTQTRFLYKNAADELSSGIYQNRWLAWGRSANLKQSREMGNVEKGGRTRKQQKSLSSLEVADDQAAYRRGDDRSVSIVSL